MNDNTSRRVELYVRSLAPCGTRNEQDAILDRLLDLERRDVVADVDLAVWGNAVCLDATSAQVGAGRRVADQIREFYRWCEDRQASLEPFFTLSTVESSITGDSFRRVAPPHRCLAVYDDGALEDVYPSHVAGERRSLEDGLRALEAAKRRRVDRPTVSEEVS